MPKFICTANSIGYLEEIIEAENEDKAWEIFQSDLENGAVSEIGLGAIEDEEVREVSNQEAKEIEEANKIVSL